MNVLLDTHAFLWFIGADKRLSATARSTIGKYAGRFAEGVRIVELDPDVAAVFPDSESVNRALRALAEIIKDREGRSA